MKPEDSILSASLRPRPFRSFVTLTVHFSVCNISDSCPISVADRSKWRRLAVACLLGLQVRTSPGAWMFVVSVVCCHVEVPATVWSLVERSPIETCVTECVLETSRKKRPRSALGCYLCQKKKKKNFYSLVLHLTFLFHSLFF
jgi:hypothetical protein